MKVPSESYSSFKRTLAIPKNISSGSKSECNESSPLMRACVSLVGTRFKAGEQTL